MRTVFTIKLILSIGIGLLTLLAVVIPLTLPKQASASTNAWPQIQLTPFASGFEQPVFITNAKDGSGRLFIVEQAGLIQIIQGGVKLATPFLDITDRVQSPSNGGGNEQGLLSVAFPPDYVTQGHFYVYYTNQNGNNEVARFQVTGNPNIADSSSEARILLLEHPGQTNHNGGQLVFGSDGYLYIGTGDGGGGGDPNGNAQNPASLLGKILRIDVEPPTISTGNFKIYLPCILGGSGNSSQPNYKIPPDNPFVNQPGYRPEIWALGVRNPWRFSFDRQTGDLIIGDVGQDAVEEIDFQAAGSTGGQNYGWNTLEGDQCYSPSSGCTPPGGYVAPVATYHHGANDSIGCSVTGGYVYHGTDFPALQGIYFYGDYCTGRIWGLQHNGGWQSQELLDSPQNISSFGEDEFGEMYLADMATGAIFQLVAQP